MSIYAVNKLCRRVVHEPELRQALGDAPEEALRAARPPLSEEELEALLAASFPNPGDADRIRQTFADDIGVDRLGVGAHRKDEDIHFAFPIVVVAGQKQAARS